MAAAVARALEEERHLVVEAGTGVGKSLAYLVPAVRFALGQKKKAIISTHTINLQEQLLYKDIPILQKVLPETFEAALIKGRQNYVCPRRLLRAREQQNDLFTGPEQNELEEISLWAARTRDGTLSDLSFEPNAKVWGQVCSEAHICTKKFCGQSDRCFYQRARRKFESAPIVVINHTLLFMLLGGVEEQMERESGFLFPNDFLILDEAHTVEQTASRQIGTVISQYLLRATVQRLYNARSKKRIVYGDARRRWCSLGRGNCRPDRQIFLRYWERAAISARAASFGARTGNGSRHHYWPPDRVAGARGGGGQTPG
jgi:Rad3-related DNA helicases